MFPLGAPHGLIKGVQSMVVYQYQPGTTAQSREFKPHSALRTWARNWAPMIIKARTEPPSLPNHMKIDRDQRSTVCRSLEDLQNCLGRLNSKPVAFSFFSFKSNSVILAVESKIETD